MVWNTAILMRLYDHGDWNLPTLFLLGDFFACSLGSYTIVITRDAYRIEGLMLAGLFVMIMGIPDLMPRNIFSDYAWVALGIITVFGLYIIYTIFFIKNKTFLIKK
ncbi:MAG: hypothetical protein D6757_03935 [Alphaproteobacteria bacterium]|nr:MAG: hypothetical protein D6757_03935 [Alphaproteobacteria bacterium]